MAQVPEYARLEQHMDYFAEAQRIMADADAYIKVVQSRFQRLSERLERDAKASRGARQMRGR